MIKKLDLRDGNAVCLSKINQLVDAVNYVAQRVDDHMLCGTPEEKP